MIDFNLTIGIIGMVLLLSAFVLNLLKIKQEDTRSYIILNIVGAGLATYYAYALNAVPFIILEAIWCLFAIYKLFAVVRKSNKNHI